MLLKVDFFEKSKSLILKRNTKHRLEFYISTRHFVFIYLAAYYWLHKLKFKHKSCTHFCTQIAL